MLFFSQSVLLAQEVQKPSKSNMTIKEWKVDAATNQKILDHVTIYNEFGKKVEEIEYDGGGQKWRKNTNMGLTGRLKGNLFIIMPINLTISANTNMMN